MKFKIKKMIALALCVVSLVTLAAVPVSASTVVVPNVRVNGELVSFPDAQPYADENSRTLIPVRFVTEEMGADVSWEQKTQTAVIKKNGITVRITIGQKNIKVIKNGKTTTVTMDTVAVGKDGRTFVPIRFVAEALGAYVDYASLNMTVDIQCDGAFTAEEIKKLRSYPMTCPKGTTYAEANNTRDHVNVWGTAAARAAIVGNYANAHEFLYSEVDYYNLGKYNKAYYENIVAQAINAASYSSKNLTVSFRADTSAIYQPDVMCGHTSVRGILTYTVNKPAQYWTTEDTKFYQKIGQYTEGVDTVGKTYTFVFDIHMKNDAFYGRDLVAAIG